jgi:tellurite resistance protein TerC
MVQFMTPLFLALVLVEFADLVFAVDSVPAVFAITTDPYIVYTSNIFAILGLRALYFALAAVLHRFHYLKYALSVLLIFIGSKIFVADLMGWEKFPAAWSLGITFAILGAGIVYSLWRSRNQKTAA